MEKYRKKFKITMCTSVVIFDLVTTDKENLKSQLYKWLEVTPDDEMVTEENFCDFMHYMGHRITPYNKPFLNECLHSYGSDLKCLNCGYEL